MLVAGVSGYYCCDGGCDKATVGTAYAKNLGRQGVEITQYDKPKAAKLCDGTVQDVITGYSVADVELITRAGTVILPRTHIDVLQGPETSNLLYLGQAEEKRLKLRSFAEQQDVARKNAKTKGGAEAIKVPESASTTTDNAEVYPDGKLYFGEKAWRTLKRTKYMFEPLASGCYVTTAALQGEEKSSGRDLPAQGVAILDLDRGIKHWMGVAGFVGKYVREVQVTLRVLPDENRDTVKRLTTVNQVTCRVVESDVPAVVIGKAVYNHLVERKDEMLEVGRSPEIDEAGIQHRLNEMLDAAREEGMTEACLLYTSPSPRDRG